jgi:hypothetical protein
MAAFLILTKVRDYFLCSFVHVQKNRIGNSGSDIERNRPIPAKRRHDIAMARSS